MVLKTERKLDEILEAVALLIIEIGALAAIIRREFAQPTRIQLSVGGTMSDTQFVGVQSSTVTITLLDAAGNPVDGAVIDPGTLTAAFADGATSFTLTPGADTTAFTVTSVAGAPAITDDVLTVNGSFNGTPLTPGTIAFDITVPSDVPTSISLAASAPA